MHPLVSVLMCVYNTEAYLHRAIDSVLAQTYHNLELVIIDDGSTDGSSTILDNYKQSNSRIVLIHQSNKGVAYSKKKLLSKAKGEYVTFVDSDDWLDSDAIADMVNTALWEKSDLVITDYIVDTPTHKKIVKQQPESLFSHNVFIQLCKGEIHGILCNKLIKKTEILENIFNNVPPHITYREDTWICGHLLNHDIKISYLPQAYYHWFYDRPGNSTSSNISKKLKLSIEVYRELESFLDESEKSILYPRKTDLLMEAFLSKQFNLLNNLSLYSEIRTEVINNTRNRTFFTPRSKCFALALKGYSKTAYVLYILLTKLFDIKDRIKKLSFRYNIANIHFNQK